MTNPLAELEEALAAVTEIFLCPVSSDGTRKVVMPLKAWLEEEIAKRKAEAKRATAA